MRYHGCEDVGKLILGREKPRFAYLQHTMLQLRKVEIGYKASAAFISERIKSHRSACFSFYN